MMHSVTRERIDELYNTADLLDGLGAHESAKLVGDAAYSLYCAANEFALIVGLLEHPKRYRHTIRDWCRDMKHLRWTERNNALFWPWKPLVGDVAGVEVATEHAIPTQNARDYL